MKFGLHSVNLHTCSYPDAAARLARAAEVAGFESLWTADHIVLPDPPLPGRPMAPDMRLLDPIVSLTFLAAHTSRGWCEPEMRASGASFSERGRVADDYLAAMRAVWTQAKPAHHGKYVSFDGVQAMPRPVQTPIPIVVGGRTPPAYRRAVTQGHGWYGFGMDVEETRKSVAALAEAGRKSERPAALGKLEISITPPGFDIPDKALQDAYAAVGVDRLILRPRPEMDATALERFATDTGRSLNLTR